MRIEADLVVPSSDGVCGDVLEDQESSCPSSDSTPDPNEANMEQTMPVDAGESAECDSTATRVKPLQNIITPSPKTQDGVSPKFPPRSPSIRLARQWFSRTFDDHHDCKGNSWADSAHLSSQHAFREHERQKLTPNARFGFSGLASAAEGAASLASSQMSALRKKVASGMRWLKHDVGGEDMHDLGSVAHVEGNQHVVYGGTLTFPLVCMCVCHEKLVFMKN